MARPQLVRVHGEVPPTLAVLEQALADEQGRDGEPEPDLERTRSAFLANHVDQSRALFGSDRCREELQGRTAGADHAAFGYQSVPQRSHALCRLDGWST